jgi:hypothetical protein
MTNVIDGTLTPSLRNPLLITMKLVGTRRSKGIRMPRTFVVTILLVASLVIVPKFVFSRTQITKAANKQAETCDLLSAGSTRYVPPC